MVFRDGAGLHVLGVTRFDDRDHNVSVLSPDLGRPVNVRVLVPDGYASDPGRHYPVLHLFHGPRGTRRTASSTAAPSRPRLPTG